MTDVVSEKRSRATRWHSRVRREVRALIYVDERIGLHSKIRCYLGNL